MSLVHNIELAQNGVLILFLKGRIFSAEDAAELIQVLDGKIDEGNKKVVFDLTDLSHVNSSGLNTLLKCFTKLRSKGGELALSNVNAHVENIFNISKLKSIFNICASTREALNFLNAQEA